MDSYMMLHGLDDEEITLTYKRNGEAASAKFPLEHTVKKNICWDFLMCLHRIVSRKLHRSF